jgi:subtilisin family serine protease
LLFLILAFTTVSKAGSEPGDDSAMIKILVTFLDPGMTSGTRAGPMRPGYRRRSSTYLTSVTVMRAARRIAEDFDLVALDDWPIVPLKVHCLVYGASNDVGVEQLLAQLNERAEIESAQLMNEFEVSAAAGQNTADPYSKLQHNLNTLELKQAHAWSLGEGTNVTIIDTGADIDHPELKTQISSHHDFVGDGVGDFSADPHGTAVAGVIGAATNNGVGMIGVAPSTRLSVLKACWYAAERSRASCDSFTLAKALSHAIDSGTDVINLSLGGPSDALLTRLLRMALDRGIVIVAAAPTQAQAVFPAEVPGVIVVGSDQSSGALVAVAQVLMSAPGDDILVPVPRGGYDYASGSSLSAAQVSGIVALLVASRPGLTSNEVSKLLLDSRPTAGTSVNACRALAQLMQKSGCRVSQTVSQSL